MKTSLVLTMLRVLKILGLPRIDRDSTSLDLNKINDSIQSVINDGNSVMVFPEGKRSNQKDNRSVKTDTYDNISEQSRNGRNKNKI